VALPLPDASPVALGDGFGPLIEIRVRPEDAREPDVVRRVIGAGRRS
jgi:hypothetical protein